MAHNPKPETATALVIKAEMLHPGGGCSGPVWWAGIDGFVNLEDSDIPHFAGGFHPQWFDEDEAQKIADAHGVPLEHR